MQGPSCDGLSLAAGQGGSSGTPQPLCSSPLSVTELLGQGGCEQRGRTSSPQPVQSSRDRAASGFIPGGPGFSEKKKPKAPTQQSCRLCRLLRAVLGHPAAARSPRKGFAFVSYRGAELGSGRKLLFFFFFSPRCTKNKTTLRKGRRPWRSRNGNPKGGQRSQEGFVSTTRGVIAAEPPVPLILKLNLLFPCVYEAHRVQAHSTSCAGELVLEGARRAELLGDTCGDLSCASKQR